MNEQDQEAMNTARAKQAIFNYEDFDTGYRAGLADARSGAPIKVPLPEFDRKEMEQYFKTEEIHDEYEAYEFGFHEAVSKLDSLLRTLGPLFTHSQPSVTRTSQSDDSLLLCASDLEHSAIYDNHSEMQDCIRSVASRIKELGKPAPTEGAIDIAQPKPWRYCVAVTHSMRENYKNQIKTSKLVCTLKEAESIQKEWQPWSKTGVFTVEIFPVYASPPDAQINEQLLESLRNTTSHLIAVRSLLQNGAASDTIFKMILGDYEKSIEVGRTIIAEAEKLKEQGR